jgi:histidinol dehydrogenase
MPSSVLMTAHTREVAGVSELIMMSRPAATACRR